jgi:aryl-alcohol dehydrogenase-like predicted oxidoreductase
MRRVILGKTGIEVSRLCFGTLTVGPLQSHMALGKGAEILAHAMRHGINFYDTAQIYGTYPYIREAMRLTGCYDAVISTKTYAHTRKLAIKAVEQAKRELNRDYIDIFMLHEQESVLTLEGHKEALDYLFECKAKGVIRAVGASAHHIAAVYGAAEKDLDVVHPLVNIDGLGVADGSREEMEDAMIAARKKNIGVFSMKPLGGGNLFMRAESCLHYVLGLESVDAVAIGMQSVEEVDANIRFFESGAFPQDVSGKLKSRTRRLLIDDWCEGCEKCAKRCAQKAIAIEDGKAVVAADKCVLCGYCGAVCPVLAIKIV